MVEEATSLVGPKALVAMVGCLGLLEALAYPLRVDL
jgi:hypothetical protein